VSRRAALVLLVCGLALSGCLTGKRPHFSDVTVPQSGTPVGDPAIDAVLGKLETATAGPATAVYEVLTKYGNTTNPASVALTPGKRNITIANARFLQTESMAITCAVDAPTACVEGFDVQRISNVGITPDFYAADTAKRLRRDAQAKVGPAVARTDNVATAAVTCVDIPVPNGTAVYCVLDNGLLAVLDDGDVRIELTVFGATVDPNAFVPPAWGLTRRRTNCRGSPAAPAAAAPRWRWARPPCRQRRAPRTTTTPWPCRAHR
jgi:hypothetical protein